MSSHKSIADVPAGNEAWTEAYELTEICEEAVARGDRENAVRFYRLAWLSIHETQESLQSTTKPLGE
jgi:hypothetical protein